MILVTGATGLSGSIVIREFARRGERVRALVRDRAKASAFEALPTVEVVVGDMARPETLGATLDEQARERLKCSDSRICLDAHAAFGVVPTTFAEFARRNAAAFRAL